MMFSNVILLTFVSITLGFLQPSTNYRATHLPKTLFSSSNRDLGLFEPFLGSNLLSNIEPLTSPSFSPSNDCNAVTEYNRVVPALSMLMILGMAGNANAAADLIVVPLHGAELYARYFLAGGICCSFSHGIAVPFDVVKTRLQTSTTAEFADTGVISVARTIVAQDGLGMLYKGLGPTLVGYFIQGSLKYGFYEIFKPLVCGELYHLDLILPDSTSGRILTFMISGFFAEFIGSTFLSPFEAARIRLVTNPTYAKGVVDCVKRIVSEEEVISLFRGLPAVFAKQIPFTVIQLASFESITTAIYSYLSRSDNDFDFNEVSKYKYAISGSSALVAAVLSSLASQPGDTLLSAVNQSSKRKPVFLVEDENTPGTGTGTGARELEPLPNPLQVMRDTVDELGVRGLYKGTKARLLHVTFYVVVQFLVYDFVKQTVGLPVTGVH